jgi:nitroreductase
MADQISQEVKEHRKPTYPCHPLILNRWSPRSMTGEEISDEELMPLFEAARWAPSSYNNQSWRFLYAKRNTPEWNVFYDLMAAGNQVWAKNAAALLVIISKMSYDRNDKPARTHSFDTGSAWMALALEGTNRGLAVHGMEGFDYDKAKRVLEIPDNYTVEAMAAIGRRGAKETLPENLQKMETPGPRRPLDEILMKGKFRKDSQKTKAA